MDEFPPSAVGQRREHGRRSPAIATIALVALMHCAAVPPAGAQAPTVPGDPLEAVATPFAPKITIGMALPSPSTADTAWGTDGGKKLLARLHAMGARAIALCPIYRMGKFAPFGTTPAPEAASLDAMRQEIQWAWAMGMHVVIRPQIEGLQTPGYFHICIRERHDWCQFFQRLDELLMPLARLAQDTHCEAISIGTRLYGASTVLVENWRTLIGRVRSAYSGKITYDADFWHEASRIPFWPDLDVVSVTVYQRLGGGGDDPEPPTPGVMLQHARGATLGIAKLWYRYRKPTWISEIGFPSNTEAARLPYQRPATRGRPDPELQADLLEVSLVTDQDKRWLSGIFLWAEQGPGGSQDPSYSVSDKPAQGVASHWMVPGPTRDNAYYRRRSLLSWLEDWF